jgi:excisionase family DNA binding protein
VEEETLYYTAEDVASFMRVDDRTVRNMANRGDIPGAVQFGKQWRFDRLKLEEHLGRRLPEPRRASEA